MSMHLIPTLSFIIPLGSAAMVFMTAGCGDTRAAPSTTSGKGPLSGKVIAILATDGVEESELLKPRLALDQAHAKTVLISPKAGTIKTWNHGQWGSTVQVDQTLADARPYEYDALVLPGGQMNPDILRIDPAACAFAAAFVKAGKPIAAICHGPWLLIEADGVRGRRMTSWPSLKSDLINAGAIWVDEEVVVDQNLVTSRKPDDIPAFNRQLMLLIAAPVSTPR